MRFYRMTFFAGLALGYVLGAQAGRERYDQMKRLARRSAESPSVQQAAGALQAQATATARSARDAATGRVRQGVAKVGRHHGPEQPATAAAASGNGAHGHHNGSGPRTDHDGNGGHRPFLPVNGSFANHDLI
ncbi:MAG: hypothetical protein ACYCVZ_03275 [Streptosporangiaceae bacterium]